MIRHNEMLLGELSKPLKDNITSNVYNPSNIDEFNDDFDQFLTRFDAEGQGFSKTTSLINYLQRFQPEIINSLMTSLKYNL